MKNIRTYSGTNLDVDENLTLFYNYLEKVNENTKKHTCSKLTILEK